VQDLETNLEFLLRPYQRALVDQWPRPTPAIMAPFFTGVNIHIFQFPLGKRLGLQTRAPVKRRRSVFNLARQHCSERRQHATSTPDKPRSRFTRRAKQRRSAHLAWAASGFCPDTQETLRETQTRENLERV